MKSIPTQNDLKFISALLKENFIPFKSQLPEPKTKHLTRLIELFNATSFEEIIRKMLFFNLINEDGLSKEYLNHIKTYSKTRINLNQKLRKKLIKLALTAPNEFKHLCIHWRSNNTKKDKEILNNFNKEAKTNPELKKYIAKNHKFWIKMLIETRVEYREIYKILFPLDKEYYLDALSLTENSNHPSLEWLYITRCFIDNNFPIKIKKEFRKEEKRLINFLLTKGDEIDYLRKYQISIEQLEKTIQSICANLNCSNINQALNLITIEKLGL